MLLSDDRFLFVRKFSPRARKGTYDKSTPTKFFPCRFPELFARSRLGRARFGRESRTTGGTWVGATRAGVPARRAEERTNEAEQEGVRKCLKMSDFFESI